MFLSRVSPSAAAHATGQFVIPLFGEAGRMPSGFEAVAAPGFPVYLVEPDRGTRIVLARELCAAGFDTRPFADAADLAAAFPELAPGCVVLGIEAVLANAALLREAESDGAFRFPTILTFGTLEEEEAIAAVRLGAADLLHRPASFPDLLAALRRAAPKVRECETRLSARRAEAVINLLSRREREVMDCMMHGMSNKEIARAMGLSPRTIEMHRSRLHKRLGVHSLAELLALAWQATGARTA